MFGGSVLTAYRITLCTFALNVFTEVWVCRAFDCCWSWLHCGVLDTSFPLRFPSSFPCLWCYLTSSHSARVQLEPNFIFHFNPSALLLSTFLCWLFYSAMIRLDTVVCYPNYPSFRQLSIDIFKDQAFTSSPPPTITNVNHAVCSSD